MLTNLLRCLKRTSTNRRWYSNDRHEDILNILDTMGKTPQHNRMAEKQRWKTEKKGKPSDIIRVQVIGTGAPGAPASVYIFSNQAR